MREGLCDADASGGIEAKHLIQKVNRCAGGSMFKTRAGGEVKNVTLGIGMRNVFFEGYFLPYGQ